MTATPVKAAGRRRRRQREGQPSAALILTKEGGRRIELFVPFTYKRRRIRSITLAPLCLRHELDWRDGRYTDTTTLLAELGGGDIELLRSVKYPDADRVLQAFFDLLTPAIRQDIAEGTIPKRVKAADLQPQQAPAPQAQPAPAPTPEPQVETPEEARTGGDEPALPGMRPERPLRPTPPPYPKPPPGAAPSWPFPAELPPEEPDPHGLGFDALAEKVA